MQVSVEKSGKLERRVTVQIPEAEIQEKVDTRLQELCKQVKIKGFRPGRVPLKVVRQRYGKQVRLEIANDTMQSSLQQAIQDEKLRPASPPQVAELPDDFNQGDIEFTAVIEVYPDIEKLDVSDLEVIRPVAEVSEADIDEMLMTLREQRRSWDAVDRAPQKDDQVLFEYVAHVDGERVPAEGHQRLAVIMGASGFETLESALSGLKADDEKTAELDFPENYREPALAGKKAEVEIKVTSVSESSLPDIDEEFVRGFEVEDGTLESLCVEVRANLERELAAASTSLTKKWIVDALVHIVPDLDVPESIVRQEAASLAARVAQQQGREAAPEETDSFVEAAQERVRGGLLMGEIASQNKIRIDGAKVRSAIETIAQTYQDATEVVQLYYGNPQLLSQVENSVLEEQVVDWVLENAKVSDKKMKFQEVITAATGANQ